MSLPNLAAAGLVGAGVGILPATLVHGSGTRSASILGGAALIGVGLQTTFEAATTDISTGDKWGIALGLAGIAAGLALAVYGGRR